MILNFRNAENDTYFIQYMEQKAMNELSACVLGSAVQLQRVREEEPHRVRNPMPSTK